MRRTLLVCLLLLAPVSHALAWDAYGHRLICRLAIEGMGQGLEGGTPTWLTEPDSLARTADGATLPDRWRSTRVGQTTHVNNPDHYLDIEDLEPYGLTLRTIPPLRHEFVRALVLGKEKAGDKFTGRPVNPAKDFAKTDEYPGFLPVAILENFGKLQASFRNIRTLEALNDPKRAVQLENMRNAARYEMGVLAHFVGDAAQPLHTTTHHHGWVGDNPNGYTTERSIHSYIDGTVLRENTIGLADVRAACDFSRKVDPLVTWEDVLTHIERSHAQVEPLYKLKKANGLVGPEGKAFISARLADGASTLAALYRLAWETSEPTAKEVENFANWDTIELK